ncbi:MAG: hypothetical protein IPK64_02930 [bacterium]|nr:hypothetical protein [bacterium]
MQDDLATDGVDGVRILGINEAGYESGNTQMTTGRDLPWLQDTVPEPVWTSWDVTTRDVVILDGANRVLSIFNLTEHPLSDAANYAALKALLASSVGAP